MVFKSEVHSTFAVAFVKGRKIVGVAEECGNNRSRAKDLAKHLNSQPKCLDGKKARVVRRNHPAATKPPAPIPTNEFGKLPPLLIAIIEKDMLVKILRIRDPRVVICQEFNSLCDRAQSYAISEIPEGYTGEIGD
jgi:hypothetical protein